MKNIGGLLLIVLFWGCTKEEEITAQKKIDLNGTFSGKVTGFAYSPASINGIATWFISHQENDLTVTISYENINNVIIPTKYQGKIVNDTTIVGGFLNVIKKSVVNGKISKDGKQISCSTDATDPDYNYVRLSFDLIKK